MELDKLLQLDKSLRAAPRRVHCLCRPRKISPVPVFLLADRRHGSPDASVSTAAFKHDGKSRSYIILRVAPVLENTVAAKMLMLIGGVSFLVTAFIAISQSNAKKVLAYSTISNLRLDRGLRRN